MPSALGRPHRLTIDVEPEVYAWITQARLDDRITHSHRMRALLMLSAEDPELTERVRRKATEIDRQALEVRQAS